MFQQRIGHTVPNKPTIPDKETGVKVLQILLEEVDELADALGFTVDYKIEEYDRRHTSIYLSDLKIDPDDSFKPSNESDHLESVARESADVILSVLAILAVYGIDDLYLLGEVSYANLRKIRPELSPIPEFDEKGKVVKPENWTPPNIKKVLNLDERI